MGGDEIRYCEDIARRFDRERWLCTLFAPEAARPTLLALVAFGTELGRVREQAREPHSAPAAHAPTLPLRCPSVLFNAYVW